MLSSSQITAHRAQSASRSKPRWQPYFTLPQTTTPNVPTSKSTHPPKPSRPPSFLRSKNLPSSSSLSAHISKDSIHRDSTKQKFALGLIDQAVTLLSDIWHFEDIPQAFLGPKTEELLSNASQLSVQQILVSTGAETDRILLPLRNFVHEVLKRSRTSGSILQTALCYLEAVRSKIPDILRDEKLGIRSYFMPDSAIQPATEAELQIDGDRSNTEERPLMASSEISPNVPQVNVSDVIVEPAAYSLLSVISSSSPLLCPRRTFLAALILASKFSQDKCYSNRAWAKLSGLPPREIGRCERALGQALDWRLWVGKKSSGSDDSVTALSSRSVVRSQSESCVFTPPSARVPFLSPSETQPSRSLNDADCNSLQNGGLRRCATVPSESFAPSNLLQSTPSGSSHSVGRTPLYQSTSSYDISDSGSSSISSPTTPSPSLSGDRTIQVSSFSEVPFPPSYNNWLGITDPRCAPLRTSSPASFLVDSKAALVVTGSKAIQTQMSIATMSIANPFLGLRGISDGLGGGGSGPGLWHADAGHVSLDPTLVQ